MLVRLVMPVVAATLVLAAHDARAAELFGVTPSAGAVGDGRLTAQVTLEGTISCLRWPNATFYEHIKHKTAGWDPDRTQNGWLKPYFGANANSGAFAGIRYRDGAKLEMRWLREGSPRFGYAKSTSNRLVGTYTLATPYETDIVIEENTFNVPDRPVLIRTYRLVSAPAQLTDFQVIAFMNPALRNEHGEYSPWDDTQKDDEARFATFFHSKDGTILTALPRNLTNGMRAAAARQVGADTETVDAYLKSAVGDWGEGVYLLQGGSEPAAGYQVGTDASLASTGPQDAFADATDGTLSRSAAVVNFETTALALPLSRDATVAWYLTFGDHAGGLAAAMQELRAQPPSHWIDASDQWWEAWLAETLLPSGAKERAFARRALISLRTGYDPQSGAIVASTSCEPPYNVDWPRDGAFFQFILDMNGKLDEAETHANFYPGIQNQTKRLLGPPGSFPMNAFADYVPGGPIDFEIDQVGFVLWAYRTHAAYLGRKSPERAYLFLQGVLESARLAADLLVTCKDERGLQCPANEDDHPEMTQTLHGAITVWLGLRSAAEMFAAMGRPYGTYAARADELAAAIRTHFPPSKSGEQGVGGGSLAWATWPAVFWAEGDDTALVRKKLIDEVRRRVLDPDTEATSYQTKQTIALLVPPLRTAGTEQFVDEVHAKYLGEMITPGTLHLAELTSYADLDGDGRKEWVNRVATPHIWGQALLYLSLVAREHPELLQAPPIHARKPKRHAGTNDCVAACASGDSSELGNLLPIAAVIAVLVLRRRRRRARSSPKTP